MVHERVSRRIEAHFAIADPRKLAEAVLTEMIPLDDRRRTEMAVNMAVVTESPSHPALRRVAIIAQRSISDACAGVLTMLQQHHLVRADADLAYETERLHALLDGLALHALAVEPKDLRPNKIRGILRAHLSGLGP